MSLVRHVDSPDDLTRLLDAKATGLVVLDFFGIHCAPCHMIAPVIDAFSKSYPTVTFVKIDTDNPKLQSISKTYNVTALPSFLFIKNKSVVEIIKGADKETIRSAIVKHSSGASAGSSSDASDISLLEFVERPQINCLNESSDHSLKSILTGHSRNTSSNYLESDTDEQLILNIPFTQSVRIRGISIKSGNAAHAPKLIKIAVNTPNIGFEDVQDAVEPQVAQVIELDEETVTQGKTIPLRFVRFQSVLSLHIFVASNHGNEDETRIDSIDIFGLPGQTSRVQELKVREEA